MRLGCAVGVRARGGPLRPAPADDARARGGLAEAPAARRPAWRCTRWPSRRWPSSSRRCTRSRSTWRCRSGCSGAHERGGGVTWGCWERWRAPPAAPVWCCWSRRLILYLYGPRRDRSPTSRLPRRRAAGAALPAQTDALWLALVPAGLVLYGAYLGPLGRRRARPAQRPGRMEPALRRPLRGRVGRAQGRLRGCPAADLDAAGATSTSRPAAKTRSWPRATT